MRISRATALMLAALGLAASATLAAIRLDTRFGSRGSARTGSGAILSTAVEPDGRVVAAGYSSNQMLIAVLTPSGGKHRLVRAGRGVGTAVAVQPDGKILVAGTTSPVAKAPGDEVSTAENGDMVLKRFNSNGSPDRAFGSGGTVRLRGAIAYGVALGPHNTIVVAGFIRGPDTTPRVALARVKQSGSPDGSFGSRGFVEVDLGRYSEANAVAVGPNGKIVFAGDQRPSLRVTNALIGRVSPSGRLDRSFGNAGVYYYFHPHGGAASSFKAVGLDRASRIVGAGGDFQNSGQHALFVRLTAGGRPDHSFGSAGALTTPAEVDFTGGDLIAEAQSLTITGSGEVLAAGRYMFGATGQAAVWAITPQGRLDARAGSGGVAKTKLPGLLGGGLMSAASAGNASLYAGGYWQAFTGPPMGVVLRYRNVPG